MRFLSANSPVLRRGLSLVELLVVAGIMVTIGSLLLAAIGALQARAEKTQALANLRQIGGGILLHTVEKNGLLPGPLWPGQMPYYDQTRPGRLAVDLAPFLGIATSETPFPVDLFVPPAFLRQNRGVIPLIDARTYVANMVVPSENGFLNPWGSLALSNASPMKLSAIPNAGQVWALSDADRLHPQVASAPWRSFTSATPFHGDKRMTLFFDGHVRLMPLEFFSSGTNSTSGIR